jgi:hypothetical protein
VPSPSHEVQSLVVYGSQNSGGSPAGVPPLQLQEDASGRADHRRPAPFQAWAFKAGRAICPKLRATRPPEAAAIPALQPSQKVAPAPRQAYLPTARIVMNYLHALFDPFVERIHLFMGRLGRTPA